MKLILVLLTVMLFKVSAETYAQSAKVSLNMTESSVKEVLKDIESKSEFTFFYNDEAVNTNRTVTIQVKEKRIDEILSILLPNCSFMVDNKKIIIVPKANKPVSGVVQQSTRKIQGRVLDDNKEPIIGAAVAVVGTTTGTVTDLDGNFELTVPEKAVLQVTYIGYQSSQTKVGNQDLVIITLKEDTQLIDEVVVVGYGTQKKLNLTGAVSTIAGKEMVKRPVTNTAAMLQGQVPGLRVVQETGQPGAENVSFRVRGNGTFSSAGSDPLVLVNGVPGSITNLDPSMIESVSVLKDAASASIYGARAANGVILVTTKQGSDAVGKVSIGYSGNFAFHSPTKMFDLVTNSAEYMELFNQAKKNSGETGFYKDSDIEKYRNSNGSLQYPSFDWLDYMFNTAFVHQHNFNLAGKTEKTTYNVALNFADQDGTLRSFNYKKYNVTLDLTTQATQWMKVGVYANLMKGDRRFNGYSPDDGIVSGMSQAPTYMPWLPDDGTGVTRWSYKAYDFELNNKNIVQIINNNKNQQTFNTTDVNAQLWLEINLMKGLTWYTKGAVRQQNERNSNWMGVQEQLYNYHTGEKAIMQGNMGMEVLESRTFYTNLYSTLKYDYTTENKAHSFSLMAGYSQESNLFQDLKAFRRDYLFQLPTIDAGVGAPNWNNSGKEEEWALMSGLFRFKYNFKDRYLFEANARYDGSSRISPEGRWGLFPSFSAAWRITEEDFMKKLNLTWLTNAKIRGSWGKLGNQNIGLYPYQAMINKVSSYPFDRTAPSAAYTQTAYVNRDLNWEETTITDIGLDLTLFDKLSATIGWYNKKTEGILRSAQISNLLGMGAPTINNGAMSNKGIELALNWNDRLSGGIFDGLNYNLGVNYDRTRNTLTEFGVTEKDGKVIREEGLPYESYYMLECIGIFATEDDIKKAPKQFNDTTKPGDLQYRDADNNGVIDNDDRTLISGKYPGFEYSFSAGANWKGFDLSLLGQGVADKKYYVNAEWGEAPFKQGSAPTKDYIKHMWTEENPYNAKYPKLYMENMGGGKNTRTNSYFLKNASYFRLKNLTFGYTLPKSITRKAFIERLRIYFSGDNLFTATKYVGLDPERPGDGTSTQYPQNRICSFGVNVDF